MTEIVVGIDGSEVSLHAVSWAAREAVLHERPLRIAHALQSWLYEMPDHSPHAQVGRWAREDAARMLDDAAAHAHLEAVTAKIATELLPGDARPALLKLAEQASMLVVGGRGEGGFAGLLLGSVAHGVASRSKCPAVVVQGPVKDSARDVVVGIDDSQSSRRAVEAAFAEASARRVTVRVVYAWRETSWATRGALPPSRRAIELAGALLSEEAAHQLLASSVAGVLTRYPHVDVIEHLGEGHPADVLIRASADAGLLVVGRRGGGGFPGLRLGSISRGVLHHAQCPVMIVPD